MHLVSLQHGQNLVYGHIYLIIRTAILCLFFLKIPGLGERFKNTLLIFLVLSMLLSVFLAVHYRIQDEINTPLLVYSSIAAILLSFLYYYDLLLHELHIPLWKSSLFYIISGLLMYHVSNTAIYVTINHFAPDIGARLWQFQSIGYIFFNLIVTFGFYIQGRMRTDE
jgi:hypothetical protein